MQPSRTRLATVRTAQRPGQAQTEDRIFCTPSAVIVLDGASRPDENRPSGGWLAETLGRELQHRLCGRPTADLTAVLTEAISAVAKTHQLTPGAAPSTTVSIVQWYDDQVHILVLGDSPVVALHLDGTTSHVRDDRLQRVAQHERNSLQSAPGFACEHQGKWQSLVAAEHSHRNRPGGYWIAEAVPTAATHAIRKRWHMNEVAAVMAMTDGVSVGIDRYGTPPGWTDAFAVALDDPRRLVDLVHSAEEDDPDGRCWPRSKRHDDKALALVELAPHPL